MSAARTCLTVIAVLGILGIAGCTSDDADAPETSGTPGATGHGFPVNIESALAETATEGAASSVLGLENADLFDETDLVFSWFSDAEQQATIEAQPRYARIPAVERGSYVVSYNRQFVTATSLLTPLMVPWAADEYAEQIEDAAAQLG